MVFEVFNFVVLVLFSALSVYAGLTHLDTPAYDSQVATNELSLVLFIANGCSACNEVYDVLLEAHRKLLEIPVGVLNCFEEAKACDEAKISAVPKLMLSVGEDELVPFSEGYNVKSIVSFAARQMGPPISPISAAEYETYANSSTITVIASIAADDEISQAIYLDPWMKILKPFDEKIAPYPGEFQELEIEDFILTASLPLIDQMDPNLYSNHIKNGLPLAHILCPPTECAQLATALYPLADRLRSQMVFMTVNSVDYPTGSAKLGLGRDVRQGLTIEDVQTTRLYPMPTQDLSVNAVEQFAMQYLQANLSASIKSADPIEEQIGSLKTLVGNNFEAVALDRNLDVLALFDVPWCDYCLELRTVLENLATRYKKQDHSDRVAVVAVDVDSNHVPTRVDQYPTIKLWRAHDNEIRTFNGTYFSMLTVEQLAEFVYEEGGHALKLSSTTVEVVRDEL